MSSKLLAPCRRLDLCDRFLVRVSSRLSELPEERAGARSQLPVFRHLPPGRLHRRHLDRDLLRRRRHRHCKWEEVWAEVDEQTVLRWKPSLSYLNVHLSRPSSFIYTHIESSSNGYMGLLSACRQPRQPASLSGNHNKPPRQVRQTNFFLRPSPFKRED